jgi:hypothetical protein
VFLIVLFLFLLTFRVSENVCVSTKPRDLSPALFWVGPLADLVGAGLCRAAFPTKWEDVQAPRITCDPQCR